MPRLLELFSGTHSVGIVAKELGYDVLSLDIDGRADISDDILEWDYHKYQPGYFDVVWASFPCHTFSNIRRCNIGRKLKHFGDEVVTAEMLDRDMIENGLPLLRKSEEIIDYFQPKLYFMENPSTGRAKQFIERPFFDVDYCMYNYPLKKPTRIWTNKTDFIPKKCTCKKKHASWDSHGGCGGSNRDGRYVVPPSLVRGLLEIES